MFYTLKLVMNISKRLKVQIEKAMINDPLRVSKVS